MASITIDKNAGPQLAEPPKRAHVATGKPKTGRPPGGPGGPGRPPLNGSAKPSAEPTALGEGSFWEYLDNLPREAWAQNLICYVWRCGPLIDTGNGKPTAITKLAQPFDVNFILENYGSGLYRFDICETPPAPGQKGKCLRRSYEMVLDMRFPPKIPIGTWIDDTRNANWQWCKPELEAEQASRSTPAQLAPQSATSAAVDALDLVAKIKEISGGDDPGLSGIVLQMLQNSQEALRNYQDPVKQMATLKSLIDMAGTGKKEDGGMTLVVEILRDEVRALRSDLSAARSQPQSNPLDAVKPVLELLSSLGVNLGGGGGGGRGGDSIASTVGDVITKVIDKASDIAPTIIQAYQFGKTKDLEIAMHGKTAANAKPWEFDPAARPAAVATTPSPTAAPPPVQTGPMTPQSFFLKWQALFNEVYSRLIDCFNNETGDDFRDWFLDRKGGDTWAAFKKDATPELLTQLTQMHPQLKAAWTPEDKVLLFFANMLDDEGDEDEDDVEPPIVKPEVVA